jgi:NADPH:quinone reductase-like Zn-dependent oxidoreductase
MGSQKAVVIQSPGCVQVVADHPIPPIEPDKIVVKVKSVALNPTDWKSFNSTPERAASSVGAVVGIDYAGIVEAVPEGEALKNWAIGDRVAGLVHGGKFYVICYSGHLVLVICGTQLYNCEVINNSC